MNTPEEILLVSYKQFFIPANARSYKALCELGMPSTRIHKDLIPLVKSAAVAKGYELRGKLWSAVLERATEKLSTFWQSVDAHCAVEFHERQWVFSTTKASAYQAARAALPKLEKSIREFFNRWGFVGEFVPSESRERIKLAVTFQMSETRMPSIGIRKDVAQIEPQTLTLGFNRLSLRRDRNMLHWTLEQQSGTQWIERISSSCTLDAVNIPVAFFGLLAQAQDQR